MKTGFAIVGFVVVALVVGTCVACVDDDTEEAGWAPSMELITRGDGDGDDNRGGRNDNGRECKDTEDCSSFSPSFEDSPIIVCVHPESCRFG